MTKFAPGARVSDRFHQSGTVLWVCNEQCPEDGSPVYRVRWDRQGIQSMGVEMCERALNSRQDEVAYSVQLTRHNPDGGKQVIEIEHYGVLSELLDALESEVDREGWQREPADG